VNCPACHADLETDPDAETVARCPNCGADLESERRRQRWHELVDDALLNEATPTPPPAHRHPRHGRGGDVRENDEPE
jgi:hypothetical protein